MTAPRRLRTAALVAVASALALTGCVEENRSSNPDDAAGTAAGAQCPVEVDDSIETSVSIGYQPIPNGDLIVRDQGWLEACLPNADITWSQLASGAEAIQAFGSGSIDVGLVGSSPFTKAVSPPNDMSLEVVWIHDVIGEAESLVVHEGSASSLEDLQGQRIAVPFASTAHYSLLAALERAGMTSADVELLNMAPDAMLAAWEREEIDAAWVWAPTLTELLESGEIVLSSADTAGAGAPTFDLGAATTEFVEANPEFMQMWTRLQDQAVRLIEDDPGAAAESIAVQLGNTPEEVASQIEGYTYLTAQDQAGEDYLGGQLGQDLLATAEFLATQQEIDEVAPARTYADAVHAEAVTAVGAE